MRAIVVGLIIVFSRTLPGQSLSHQFKTEKIQPIDNSVSFRGIFAINENDVWVSGTHGAIYHSINGGKSFQKIEIPNASDLDFRDIHCFPNHTILVMSVGNGSNSRIYKSTDDGRTWRLSFQNQHQDGFLNSIAFWDTSHGIAVGDPVNGHVYILLTSDGGDHWEEVDLKQVPDALTGECGFAASGTCVTVLGTSYAWIGMGGPKARIYKTPDRGKSWHVYETPILCGKNSTGIFSVYFENEKDGVVVGGDYTEENSSERTIALTKDGGMNWLLLKNGTLPFQSSVGEVLIEGEQVYISTGPVGIYGSKDGAEWEKISHKGYHCLSVSKDRKVVWLAGSSGRVARLSINRPCSKVRR